MSSTAALSPTSGPGLRLLLAILIVALNLRGAVTSVGPLLDLIQAELELSSAAAGFLASLPLFAFAFVSPYAAILSRRIGIEAAIFVALLSLLAGIGLRHVTGSFFLYTGTALIGIGIAINNVLLPGLLRREFLQQLPLVTALFTMVLVTVGGLGSALAIPLEALGGWRPSLLAWLLPVVIGLVVWAPRLRHNTRPQAPPQDRSSLWRSSVAWYVSLFMACQSTAFYVMIAWLPSLLADLEGISPARSGVILFIYQIFVLGGVMGVPVLVHRFDDQRWIGAGCASLIFFGYAGLLFATADALFWLSIMGLGAGGSLVLAMTWFGLRASSTGQAVALSGMAQAIGYLVSALAPILVGWLHDATAGWTVPLLLMLGFAATQVCMGYLSGRPLRVGETAGARTGA
jgi:CP family cyanate transporter-like MFS transporter